MVGILYTSRVFSTTSTVQYFSVPQYRIGLWFRNHHRDPEIDRGRIGTFVFLVEKIEVDVDLRTKAEFKKTRNRKGY